MVRDGTNEPEFRVWLALSIARCVDRSNGKHGSFDKAKFVSLAMAVKWQEPTSNLDQVSAPPLRGSG